MAKEKFKFDKKYKIMSLAILALVLMTFCTVWGLKQKNQETSNTTPTQEDKFPVDTVNDGVYTNYKYGFKFEYPKIIFKTVTSDGNSFYENESNPRYGATDFGLRLDVFTTSSSDFIKIFHDDDMLSIGQPKFSDAYLKSFSSDDDRPYENKIKAARFTNGHLIYSYYSGWGGVEPFYGYIASWKNKEVIVNISIYNTNELRKQEQLNIINGIIKSMRFFDLSTPSSNN
ncbi:MAG TPA: hypothetical protein VL401_00200 [Alphaproteobacteria bacterium]|jgi:hypothetical protein|nr:hypothetical protein [Alphaproteobacteria bacterium]